MKKILVFLSVLFFALSCYKAGAQSVMNGELDKYVNKYGQVLFYINNYYLDSTDNDKISDEAIKALISTLDPHSSYVSADEVQAMNEPLEGNFEGVGIEFAIIRDTLTVASPISGGPSEKVGIRAGDKIVEVDGENIASVGITNDMVFDYLRGPKGSKVVLSVERRGVSGLLEFEVIRDKIPINSVDAVYEPADGVVYVKLSRFASKSSQEIISGILKLGLNEIKGFILDLRGNSGGYLGTAMEVSNFFLEAGQTIVYTEGMRVPKMTERAKGTGFYKDGLLAILVDENSASASEIVAGAVQDWDRGVIIGRRTFGKGLVQQMLPLNDGSQLRLTVARYHTPSGRVIQSPYEEGGSEKYYRSFLERYERGESFSRDSIHFPDSLKYKTLVRQRTIYGGGGIMPDIFIPADTTSYSEYYSQLMRRGVILDFVNDYFDSHREEMEELYDSFGSYNRNFEFEGEVADSLLDYAHSRGIEYSNPGYEKSKGEIASYVKALIARSLFESDAFYKVLNGSDDEAFDAALNYVTGKDSSIVID
jgi:carboxyl-terminal processing protease